MTTAGGALHLGALHTVTRVVYQIDLSIIDRAPKTWPTATALKLCITIK